MRQIIILLCCLCLLPACLSRREHPSPPAVVALINNNPIKEDQLRSRILLGAAAYDESIFKDPTAFLNVKKETLNQMIENRAIIDWGRKQNIVLTVEEKAVGITRLKKGYSDREFQNMLDEKKISYSLWTQLEEENLTVQKIMQKSLYPEIKVSENELATYYKSHLEDFAIEEQVRVRQIAADSEAKAAALRQRVLKGENFAKVAIMHSISPDRANGGDLGYFPRGNYPKEFDDACFSLKPGEISPVIKSPYGFHIFKLINKRPKGYLTLEEVLPRIESILIQKKMAESYKPWLNRILSETRIQIMEGVLRKMEML